MQPLYARAEQSEQSRRRTEMEQVTGWHRKNLLRLLHAPLWSAKSEKKAKGARLAEQWNRPSLWSGKTRFLLRRTTDASLALRSPASGSRWHAADHEEPRSDPRGDGDQDVAEAS